MFKDMLCLMIAGAIIVALPVPGLVKALLAVTTGIIIADGGFYKPEE